MTVKFKEEVCGCGLNLTAARPAHVIPTELEEDVLAPVGECPACHRSYVLDYGPEDKAFGPRTFVTEGPGGEDVVRVAGSAEPPPTARRARRGAPESAVAEEKAEEVAEEKAEGETEPPA